jgi:hypothetical protein
MINITKIINKNNEIEIHHSNNVIDKRTNYDIQFDSVYKGYTDHYIGKEVVQSKKPQFSQLKCTLYLSTEKYEENPEKWIKIFKESYTEKYGKYKWYKELSI